MVCAVNEGEAVNRGAKFGGEERLLRKWSNVKGRGQGEEALGEEGGGRGERELEEEKISMKCEISYECLFNGGV